MAVFLPVSQVAIQVLQMKQKKVVVPVQVKAQWIIKALALQKKRKMSEWVNNIINSDQGNGGLMLAAFFLGLLASFTSCCNYALIGSVAGYTAGNSVSSSKKKHIRFSLAFLIGCVFILTVLGGIVGYIGSSVIEMVGNYWKLIAAIIFIVFGLLSFGLLPIKVPTLKIGKHQNVAKSGLLLGVITGGLSMSCTACCNPVLPLVLGAAFIKVSWIWGMFILFAFSIGYSLPFAIAIAGIRFGAGKLADKVRNAGKIIIYIAGAVMIIAGFYMILTY
jgi:cytochrome c-type biogenesis protein